MAAILPDLNQLQRKDFESVYEPSDDTFLLCDALEGDRSEITSYSRRHDACHGVQYVNHFVVVFAAVRSPSSLSPAEPIVISDTDNHVICYENIYTY